MHQKKEQISDNYVYDNAPTINLHLMARKTHVGEQGESGSLLGPLHVEISNLVSSAAIHQCKQYERPAWDVPDFSFYGSDHKLKLTGALLIKL